MTVTLKKFVSLYNKLLNKLANLAPPHLDFKNPFPRGRDSSPRAPTKISACCLGIRKKLVSLDRQLDFTSLKLFWIHQRIHQIRMAPQILTHYMAMSTRLYMGHSEDDCEGVSEAL